MKPFLHLSIRDHDDAVAKEFDAIASFGGLKPGQLVQLRVEQAPLPVIHPDDYSGLIIGGVVVAPSASELILPIAIAVSNNLTVKQLAEVFAVYPSLSGSITEAARRLVATDDLA